MKKRAFGVLLGVALVPVMFAGYLIGGGLSVAQPEGSAARVERARLLMEEGNLDDAADLFRQALADDPAKGQWRMEYGSLLFSRGMIFRAQGHDKEGRALIDEAEQELLLALESLRGQRGTDDLCAQCYFLLGEIAATAHLDHDKALQYYERCLGLSPRHQGALIGVKRVLGRTSVKVRALPLGAALAAAQQGRYDQALAILTKIVTDDPRNDEAWYQRGVVHRMQGAFEKAVEDFSQALAIAPQRAELYQARAIVRFFLKDYDASWEDVRHCYKTGGAVDGKFIDMLKEASGRIE